MWYLRKVASSCEQFGPVSTYLYPKYIEFCFQNLVNDREDANGRRSKYPSSNSGTVESVSFSTERL